MLRAADRLLFHFRKAPDLCQWACCQGHFRSSQHRPRHLKAHTQKNTQWFLTAAWKGWHTHSGIPKAWVCCWYFITCFALDCRQLPFLSSLTLMGQQAFNWLSATHYLHILPRYGCIGGWVCACVYFNDLLAKFLLEWIPLFCQIIPPAPSASRAHLHYPDAILINKDSVIRKSGATWKTSWQDHVSEKQSIREKCRWAALVSLQFLMLIICKAMMSSVPYFFFFKILVFSSLQRDLRKKMTR